MAVNNLSDSRINARSPYYIEAGREAPEVVTIPDPVEDNTPPTVTISATNINPFLGDTVTLTANATDSDGTIASYLWGGTSTPLTTQSIDITNTDTVESQTYYVVVTDDDGDTANAQITINWQEEPQITYPTLSTVQCGDIVNEANFVGEREYTLDVGDKIGNINVTFLTPSNGVNSIPVNFTATWDSTTETTGYIGDSIYDNDLTTAGVQSGDINTSATQGTTNKGTGTTLSISKTAATPETISLKAFSVLGNDSYKFRLDCPDVLRTRTKFVTLESTCTGGTARFTYTDVNGVTQEVVIEDGGQPVVVSAQPDTAVVSQCTGTVTEGGDSFELGTPDKDVNDTLEINIILDGSGFHSTSGGDILAMTNGILRKNLIKFYSDNVAEYEKRVRVVTSAELYSEQNSVGLGSVSENQNEGFLKILSDIEKRNSDTTRIVNLYFLDEVNPVYNTYGKTVYSEVLAGGTNELARVTSTYTSDLASYKTHLDTLDYGDQLTTLFQVDNVGTPADWFKNVINGTGTTSPNEFGNYNKGFEGARGLSDRASEISLVSNIRQGVSYQTEPNYYYDLVIQALRDYGYKI